LGATPLLGQQFPFLPKNGIEPADDLLQVVKPPRNRFGDWRVLLALRGGHLYFPNDRTMKSWFILPNHAAFVKESAFRSGKSLAYRLSTLSASFSPLFSACGGGENPHFLLE
jgi:hypothetical protein